jgi:tellurite resistance protein TerC
VWISLALLFGVGIYFVDGRHQALLYFTGYLIEESLSVDNLFVFYVIFKYFKTPKQYEHRILFWGIIGALIFRLSFILAGVALLERFHWLVYVLGAFLVYSKSMATREWDSGKLFVRKNGKLMLMPAFVVLAVIEVTDIVFALDSIPAVLGITTDPFIVYTSNAMAILGLRSLYSAIGKDARHVPVPAPRPGRDSGFCRVQDAGLPLDQGTGPDHAAGGHGGAVIHVHFVVVDAAAAEDAEALG